MVVSKSKPGKANNEASKLAESLFEEFAQGSDAVDILVSFQKLKAAVGVENLDNGKELYGILKSKLQSWKCKSLWEVLDSRAKHKEYGNGTICEDMQVLVIGSGPIGLRTAIEVALLGARAVVVEKRTSFSRNNVLHLWPFLIQDFRSLGAKRFYGKFCAGSLDHISIRVLQCMLMKTALILGVQIYTGVTFEKMVEPTTDTGWRCRVNPPFHPASQLDFDVVIAADGKKNVLPDFPQIEMRGSLAIGITLNLVYHSTKEEAAITEVSGLAYHFRPQFFDELYQKTGVRLENFVYYKNETHYFVMTAVKSSLLARGALLMDYPKPGELLAPQNVNQERLVEYALDAVRFGTEGKLTNVEFKINDRGKPDIAVFDFTSLKKAEHAARIVERKGHRLLMALVGDSLIEPFWPTGSGCARGVLSALDTAWMLRSFAMDKPPLQVLSERENIFKLLSATTTENLRKKFDAYTINPFTRYVDINLKRVKEVYHLYDSDDPVNADFRVGMSPTSVGTIIENTRRRLSSSNKNVKIVRNRRKSSSDDLDVKKDAKNAQKKKKLSRSMSRSTDDELRDTPSGKNKTSKSKKLKKLRSRQSSESADEKDVRGKRQRKLGRTKSRDTDGSNNSLDTITESPKGRSKVKGENKDNSSIMKQRSTKRWRLFGGSKPRPQSVSSDEHSNKESEKGKEKKQEMKSNDEIKQKGDVGSSRTGWMRGGSRKGSEAKKGEPGITATTAAQLNAEPTTHRGSIKKPLSRSISRQQSNQENATLKPLRSSLRKPSEVRAQQKAEAHAEQQPDVRAQQKTGARTGAAFARGLGNRDTSSPKTFRSSARLPSELRERTADSFARSISHSGVISLPDKTAPDKTTPQLARMNSESKRKEGFFSTLRRSKHDKGAEEEKAVTPAKETPQSGKKSLKAAERIGGSDGKHIGLETRRNRESKSVFEDMKSLSPAAQRTAPVLATLTPEKKDGKYSDGAVTAVAGIAALVALTTPLAMEERAPLKEFQIERQKILSSRQVNVKEKIALLNTARNRDRNFRRDLTSALDSADGSPKQVKRFFSFSTAQRNVKQKLEVDSHKSMTLPRKNVARHSLQSKLGPTTTDIPSALDSAIDILVKQYTFKEIQNTLKLMLNIFRYISTNPDDEIPRRVCTKGETFHSVVWNMKEAKLFMIVSGWMEIGTFILFPKSKTVHEPIRVLMQNYRTMSVQQDLDISCPPNLPSEPAKRRRRVSDDGFRPPHLRRNSSGLGYMYGNPPELAKDDGKDTESHSSDSGMGFSETASEHNIAAVMTLQPVRDVDDDVAGDAFDDVGINGMAAAPLRENGSEISQGEGRKTEDEPASFVARRMTDVMNPKRYLEDSSEIMHQGAVVNPKNYIMNDSSAGEEKHFPNGVHNSPSAQTEQQKATEDPSSHNYVRESSLVEAKNLSTALDQLLGSLDEPTEVIDHNPLLTPEDTADPNLPSEVPQHQERRSVKDNDKPNQSGFDEARLESDRVKGMSAKERNYSSKRNELDDLFDTLDFVADVLEPPRVVYDVKPMNEPKKSERQPKSTETTRRREYLTRSKLRGDTTEERPSPKSKRRARNHRKTTGKKDSEKNGVDYDGGKASSDEMRRQEKSVRNGTDSSNNTKYQSKERRRRAADQENPDTQGSLSLQLRRSRRIADTSTSGRNAILTLDTSNYPAESSTDLNQAFVNSTLEESVSEPVQNGSAAHQAPKGNAQKKKVRRKSSIVKTNKSRARAKRSGFKSRKDRSIEM